MAIYFIVFWERDITSEHHGTPVHISNTVYTHYLFPILFPFPLLSLSLLSRAFDPLYTTRPEGLITSLNSLGAKLSVVCAGPRQPPNCWRRCHLPVVVGVLLETNLGIFTEGNLLLSTSQPSTLGN